MNSQVNALEIRNLVKTYGNGTQALKGLSLEIRKGDFYALLGMNGAGKTTTIGILTDLVNKTSGEIKVFGHDLDKEINKVKAMLGVVPQEFNFDFFSNCIDIVVNMGGYYGLNYFDAKKRAIELLNILGLGDKINQQAKNLSGGMKRRLMIARSLIHEPKLLILDEPTVGVDIDLRIGMWKYLKEINTVKNITILLTTHNLEEVEELCNRAAIIKDGKVILQDTIHNLINANERQIYILDSVENNITSSKDQILALKNGKVLNINQSQIEFELTRSQNMSDFISELSKFDIPILGLKPKSNRLEQLFLNIIK
jgi:ABC-2 type transport system ATP-binding protein